jgi:hypothetical protein
MNGPRRTLEERLKAISGTLGILIALLALVPQFSKNISDTVDAFINLPPIAWYLAPVLLLIIGIFALRDGLARRSRLLRPEALQLKADNPAHLKGRSEDIQRLSMLCHECQQVHLVGESGAGKSALIQAGLWPALTADKRLFPIYLTVWGQDWQDGPRTALSYALWEALSEEDRGTLGLTTLPQPENLVVILDQCREKLGRIPLLIFDQFDDYQTRHRTRFLSPRRRTWISADGLTEANAFWRDVKKLIDDKVVHCLFATRSDTADGLESIRFVDPQVYPLDRLNATFVLPLLTELTAQAEGIAPVVFAPHRGWGRLKERLARDLSEDGAVLPVQMKIALQWLARLKSLTVRDYERADRLRGLEAAYVEWRIVNTARHSGLTEIHVRTLLTSLADAETLKTVPRSTADLAKTITVGNTADPSHLKGAVEVALDDMERKEIVRKRLDPDTRQHVWVLDHDYLCRGVAEVQKVAARLVTIIERVTNPYQAGALVEALEMVPRELAPAEVQKVAVHFIAMIERATEPMHLWTLTEALKTVLRELGPAEAQKIFAQLIIVMERITEPNQDMAVIGTLRAMPGTLDPQQLISLLKWPTSVGTRRSTFLSLLEKQTGQKFENNVWKMVTWAQANGLDVKSPPKRPDK